MRPYTELPGLEHLYLEESYVLDVEAHPGRICLTLDLVLTADHVQHRDPLPGEKYCYRHGELRFSQVTHSLWSGQGRPPARDVSGEVDYGNVDSFEWDESGYRLEGGWGRMQIHAAELQVVLTPTSTGAQDG